MRKINFLDIRRNVSELRDIATTDCAVSAAHLQKVTLGTLVELLRTLVEYHCRMILFGRGLTVENARSAGKLRKLSACALSHFPRPVLKYHEFSGFHPTVSGSFLSTVWRKNENEPIRVAHIAKMRTTLNFEFEVIGVQLSPG